MITYGVINWIISTASTCSGNAHTMGERGSFLMTVHILLRYLFTLCIIIIIICPVHVRRDPISHGNQRCLRCRSSPIPCGGDEKGGAQEYCCGHVVLVPITGWTPAICFLRSTDSINTPHEKMLPKETGEMATVVIPMAAVIQRKQSKLTYLSPLS